MKAPEFARITTVAAIAGMFVIAAISAREYAPPRSGPDAMTIVLTRRGAYGKSCPEHHVEFSRFMTNGYVDGVAMRQVNVGVISAPSGVIIAADPFYFEAEFTSPFRRRIRPGKYPVSVAVADLGRWGNRVAFATLRISNKPVTHWRVAETEQPKLNQFFGVDAGMAALADRATAKIFAAALKNFEREHPKGNYYDDVLSRRCPANSDWCNYYPDPHSSLNSIIVHSGIGDGLYASYWGLDARDEPALLIIDFQLFDDRGSIVRQ